jgi:hypothetical protein
MAKKAKKKTGKRRSKSTDWSLGQPLAFPKKKIPTDVYRLARSVIESAIEENIIPKKQKQKKT